jgi:uncharacterized damage-inducible protein DinB
MFRRMEDFISCWKEEASRTLAVMEAIPDAAMGQAVNAEHRDLKRMGWHLVETLIEMPGRLGVEVEGAHLMEAGLMAEPPQSMVLIRDAYARASASLLSLLESWPDGELERENEMYGETWKRGFTLGVLVAHQTHHRGQMTVLMRQAGLKVPDIYGPAKEGWAAYGMEAPRV